VTDDKPYWVEMYRGRNRISWEVREHCGLGTQQRASFDRRSDAELFCAALNAREACPTWGECYRVALHLSDELPCVAARAEGGDAVAISMAGEHAKALNNFFRMFMDRAAPNPRYRKIAEVFEAFDDEMAACQDESRAEG
jgi:hypothetical protein